MATALYQYHQTYEKILLLGDFNAKDIEPSFSEFLEQCVKKILSERKLALNTQVGLVALICL